MQSQYGMTHMGQNARPFDLRMGWGIIQMDAIGNSYSEPQRYNERVKDNIVNFRDGIGGGFTDFGKSVADKGKNFGNDFVGTFKGIGDKFAEGGKTLGHIFTLGYA